MDRFRTMMMVAILVLMSQAVTAEVHHENYDEAKLQLGAVAYHMQNAFYLLNVTINDVNNMDPVSAGYNSFNFSGIIKNAKDTLENIPDDVDSYRFLEAIINGFGETEIDLDILIEGLGICINATDDLMGYSFQIWTAASISENLTMAERGSSSLPRGLTLMEEGRELLVDDVNDFLSYDIEGSWKELAELDIGFDRILDGLETMEETVTMIGENLTSADEIIRELMVKPMKDLNDDIVNLTVESDPDTDLMKVVEIMEVSVTNLSSGMRHTIIGNKEMLDITSREIFELSDSQEIFLENITLLENEINMTLPEKIKAIENCIQAYNDMDFSYGIIDPLARDLGEYDGGVISNVSLLGDLLDSYQDRIYDVTIEIPDLQLNADDIDSIMHFNIIKTDIDGNGKMDWNEAAMLSPDSLPGDLLEQLIANVTESLSELKGVPRGYFNEMTAILPTLRSLLDSAVIFTDAHHLLISIIMEIVNQTRAYSRYEKVSNAFQTVMRMEQQLDKLIENGEHLRDMGLIFPASWEDDLGDMISLYMGFLSSEEMNISEPFMVISLEYDDIPYDTDLGYSIMAMDIDPLNNAYLPDGRTVDLDLDGENMTNLVLENGHANGSLRINRSMDTGGHRIDASMIREDGNRTDCSAVFNVRKIDTSLHVGLIRSRIDIGENTSLAVDVIDEFYHALETNITLLPDGGIHPSDSKITLSDLPHGRNEFKAMYPGDDHYDRSDSDFKVDVYRRSGIEISSNGVLFGHNETINITAELLEGNGTVRLTMDGEIVRTAEMGMEDQITWEFYTGDLGNGTFMFRAKLLPLDHFTHESRSMPLFVTVELFTDVDTPVSGDDDDLPDINETPYFEPDDQDPLLKREYQWIVFATATISFSLIALFFIVKRKKKRKGVGNLKEKERFHLPGVYIRKRKKTVAAEEIRSTPVAPPPYKERSDPDREELIRYYLEVIRRSPRDLGLTYSMTPREIGQQLERAGFPGDVASRLSNDFELSIYKRGIPERDTVDRFREDQGRVRSWFSSLLQKMMLPENGGEKT